VRKVSKILEDINIDVELRQVNNSIDEYLLDFRSKTYWHSAAYIYSFNLKEYENLIVKLNQIRYAASSYQEKSDLFEGYKKIHYAKRLKLRRLLDNLKNDNLEIKYNKELDHVDCIEGFIRDGYRYDNDLSVRDNITIFLEAKIKARLYEVNNDIYRLKNFPYEYINTLSTFIAPYNPTKYDKDIIFYKDVFICHKDHHHFGVYYNENTLEETKRAILNILAYINAEPFFYLTDNPSFNRKIDDLYKQFDLMDMLRLRKENYFDLKVDDPYHIESPIIKTKKGYNFIEIKNVQHEMMFELYHASLKQFESLPRCFFLYRAFEYGNNFYYNPRYCPANINPETVLNHLFNLSMSHDYMPLYYVDFGTYLSDDNRTVVKKRKAAYRNFILKLKNEAKTIIEEWSHHPYLNNKSVGEIVYKTGRNASAHGGGAQHNARYDYSHNYRHINDVNIILELIVRFLIEKMNPNITKMIERRKKCYIQFNDYGRIFEEDNTLDVD